MNNKPIYLIFLACLTTLFVCVSCNKQTTIQRESVEMQKADMQYAYSLLEQNKKTEAAEIFEKVIYSNPHNSRAHLELAIIYHQTNDFINAMYHYRQYGKLQPNSQKMELISDQLSLAKKEFTYIQNKKAADRKKTDEPKPVVKHKPKPKAKTIPIQKPENMPAPEYINVDTNIITTLKKQNLQLTEEIEILKNKIWSLDKTIKSQAEVLRNRQKQISEYTILAGENLEGIALKIYGDPEKWRLLYNTNKEKLNLKTANNIQAGQILTIPWD